MHRVDWAETEIEKTNEDIIGMTPKRDKYGLDKNIDFGDKSR